MFYLHLFDNVMFRLTCGFLDVIQKTLYDSFLTMGNIAGT